MFDSIAVHWGDRTFKATWENYDVVGIRLGKSGVINQPLMLRVKGQSAHEYGEADVSIELRMSRNVVYDLFEAVLEFRARDNPALKRIGKALLRELRTK